MNEQPINNDLDNLAPLQVIEQYAQLADRKPKGRGRLFRGRFKSLLDWNRDPVPGVSYRTSPTTGKQRPIKPKPNRKMTKLEFLRGYAKRSGVTVEQLSKWGRYAKPCYCGDESCQGWQMVHTK